jgi:hypothetical protein
MNSLARLEAAEGRLVVLASRLAPCLSLTECNSLLSALRKEKAALLATEIERREAEAS